MSAIGVVVAVAFVVGGVLAYTGRWKGWITVRRGYGSTMGFAWLWLGLALSTGSLALLFASWARGVFFVLVGVAAALMLVAIVGFFWLPAVLLPRWFRDLRGDHDAVRG